MQKIEVTSLNDFLLEISFIRDSLIGSRVFRGELLVDALFLEADINKCKMYIKKGVVNIISGSFHIAIERVLTKEMKEDDMLVEVHLLIVNGEKII